MFDPTNKRAMKHKIEVPIFDIDGDEVGVEVIEVTEIESVADGYGDTFRRVQLIELSDYTKAHPDDVQETLNEYYGFGKYRII